MVALVLELLERVDDIADRLAVKLDAERLGFHLERRTAGHLRHEHAGAVADRLRIDVLVGVARPAQRRGVQACLVRERRRAHVRLLRVDREVHELGHMVGNRGEVGETPLRQTLDTHLELEVGHDRHEVTVADPFAITVDRALHLGGTRPHGGEGVGDATAGVVVEMDADLAVDMIDDRTDRGFDIRGKRPAVGVAQHDGLGTGHRRRFHDAQAELGVAFEAVKEVFGIEEHPLALGDQVLDRIGHHRHTLVEGGLQRLGDVVVPALPDDADDLGAGGNEVREGRITVDLALRSTSGTKRHKGRRRQVEFGLGPLEELVVLRVGARPTTLDERNTEAVELLGDAQLVVDRQRNALQLTSVAEGRVVDVDLGGPGRIVDSAAVDDGHDASSFQARYVSFLPRTRSA